jgi:hypothetical protein
MTNTTLLLTRVTSNDCEIWRGSRCSLRAPCPNPGLRRWLTKRLCLAHRGRWPKLCHPHVASDGGIGVPQLDAEILDVALSGQKTSAQLHRHILVVYHHHPGDILLDPIGLELILLPIGQEVVVGVLQLTLIATDPQCDGLPACISNSVAVRGPESWSLVFAKDSGSEEDLCYGFELHPPWTWDFLDPVPGGGGEAQLLQ